MSLPFEIVGTPCPDPLLDPIEYHVWHEAHRCGWCGGGGRKYPETCAEAGRDLGLCPYCDGTGLFRRDWFDLNL